MRIVTLVAAAAVILCGATPTALARGDAFHWTDPTERPDTPEVTTLDGEGDIAVMRTWYAAWNGRVRSMLVVYPKEPKRPLPLIVALHAATGDATCDNGFVAYADDLQFAVACIGGQGAATRGSSYGAPGQIDDVLRVPDLVRNRADQLPLDDAQTILAGSSMGGMEALLAADRSPERFSTVVSLDAPVDLTLRFRTLGRSAKDEGKRRALIAECGGTPTTAQRCFAQRSPITQMGRMSAADVPVVMEWSRRDRIGGLDGQSPLYAKRLAHGRPTRCVDVRVSALTHGASWMIDMPTWLSVALGHSAGYAAARAAQRPYAKRGATCG